MVDKRVNIIFEMLGLQDAEGKLTNFGKTIGKITAAWAAYEVGVKRVIGFINDSVKAYAEQARAENRLSTTLGKNTFLLKEYANQLMKLTVYGDEQIINAQSMLASFIKNEEGIKKATRASIDLATALGIDLQSAAMLVAKSIGSDTSALSRYGIAVKGAADSTERLDSVTQGIQKRFGGMAENEARTFEGQVKQLSNAFNELQEQIGGTISRNLQYSGVLRENQGLIESLTQYLWENEVAYAALDANFSGQTRRLNELLGVEEKEEVVQKRRLANQKTEQAIFKTTIEGGLYAAYVEQVKAEAAAKEQLAKFQERYTNSLVKVGPTAGGELSPLKATFDRGAKAMSGITVKAYDDMSKAVLEYADTVQSVAGRISDVWANALQNQWDLGQNFFQNMLRGFEQMLASMAAQLASRAAIFGIFSALGVGGLLGGFSQFLFKGFQHGADFTVGGSGGPDSKLVAFRASPGERVTVTPPGQVNNSQSMVINFNSPITDKRFIQQEIIPEIKRAVRLGLA